MPQDGEILAKTCFLILKYFLHERYRNFGESLFQSIQHFSAASKSREGIKGVANEGYPSRKCDHLLLNWLIYIYSENVVKNKQENVKTPLSFLFQ